MYFINLENGRDGFGAQFFNILYSILLAKYYNIEFSFQPLDRIGHNYENNKNFENELNKFTNLVDIFPTIKMDEARGVNNINSMNNILSEKTDKKILLSLRKKATDLYKYIDLFNTEKKLLDKVIDNFLKDKKNPYDKSKKNIAIHIRSGDILFNIKVNKHRFTDINYYIKLINYIHKKFKKDYLIHLFYESRTTLGYGDTNVVNVDPSVFQIEKLMGPNVVLHENGDVRNDFLHFIFADYLILAKSSYSITAGLFNRNRVYAFSELNDSMFGAIKHFQKIDINNINFE